MILRRDYRKPGVVVTLVISCAVVVANIPFILTPASSNQYRAESFSQFALAFFRHLAWPNVIASTAWLGPFMFLPFLWLLIGVALRKQPAPRSSYAIIALGFWTLIVTLSLSYLRGKYAPFARYYDYNCFHVIICAYSLIEVWRLGLIPSGRVPVFTILASFWVTAVAIGGMHLLDFTINYGLPQRKRELRFEQAAVKKFIETRDMRSLEAPELSGIFPFTATYAAGLAKDLQDQQVIRFLPPEMTPIAPEQKPKLPLLSRIRVLLLRAAYKLFWVTMSAFALVVLRNLLGVKSQPRLEEQALQPPSL